MTNEQQIQEKAKELCNIFIADSFRSEPDEIKGEMILSFFRSFASQIAAETTKKLFFSECEGCPEGHSSFWRTVTMSPEWQVWEKSEQVYKKWDVDECRECGFISEKHFAAFLNFIRDETREEDAKLCEALFHGAYEAYLMQEAAELICSKKIQP